MDDVLYGLVHVFELKNIIFMILGVTVGIIIGALPGLSVTLGVALMLPFTFTMDADSGLLILIGVYVGGVFGGSITAILLKTPGSPASAATVEDGFILSQQGKASQALGMSLYASAIAGLLSGFALLLLAPQIAKLALGFGPPEFFMLTLFGMTVIAGVSSDNLIKGLMMASLGMLIGTIGVDPIFGNARFSFGQSYLLSGVGIIPALIGLFALSEILLQIEKGSKTISVNTEYENKPFTIRNVIPHRKTIFKSSTIGIIVGSIPGTGAIISSFLSYNEARRVSKVPESFGKGSLDGIAASEAGNNGVTGATLIPMMTLGIPGDTVTAILLGSLIMQGLSPGPQLFENNGGLVYTVIIGFIIINVIMFILGKFSIRWFANVAKVPSTILFPIILGLSMIGAFASVNAIYAAIITLVFGVLGYVFIKNKYPIPPLLIGIVLGPLLEKAMRQTFVISDGSILILFERPITIFFILLIFLSLTIPIFRKFLIRKT